MIAQRSLTLGLFALCCTGLVALTEQYTRPLISAQQRASQQRLLNELISQEPHDNDLLTSCQQLPNSPWSTSPSRLYTGYLQQQLAFYVVTLRAPNGYNGPIELMAAIKPDGTLINVRVTHHLETPGLGDKIERAKSPWIDGFSGQRFDPQQPAQWAVKKDGGQFDGFTGATITPRAIVVALGKLSEHIPSFSLPPSEACSHDA